MRNRKKIYAALLTILTFVLALQTHAPFVLAKFLEYGPKPRVAGAFTSSVNSSTEDPEPVDAPENITLSDHGLRLPVLMYHHVGDLPPGSDTIRRGLTVSAAAFNQQVNWVKQQGYTTISFSRLWEYLEGKSRLPQKPIIFSFDDGYDDVFTNALPVLQKYGFTGTFGIITEDPGTRQGTNSYATWDTIANAKKQGAEIVCHTQNHFDGSNPKFSAEYIFANLVGCQKDLTGHLGSAEPFLIYPYGHSTPLYIGQAKKAGFVFAFTVHEGKELNLEDLFHLPRVRVSGGEALEEFEKKLEGY